jgi:hypothetical protein
MPGGHTKHAVWPPMEKDPGEHAWTRDGLALSGQAYPGGQTEHDVCPAAAVLPGGQGTGATMPEVGTYDPAGLEAQAVALPSAKVPGRQGEFWLPSTSGHCQPMGQGVQATEPATA